jgi:sodium transport system ATP-binding protein
MREVERLCDRVAIMNRGQVLDSGSLTELSERHKTSDFEELFYQLIMASEQSRSKAATRGIWFEDLGVPGVAPMNTAGGM